MGDRGAQAAAWLAELGEVSDEPGQLTRTFLSPGLERAKSLVARWMQEVGLEVFEDASGNLIGRRACDDLDATTLTCGSHLDTVRNAGKYDGAMGVVVGLLAAAELKERGMSLPYHLEVVGFSDEEGVRFQSTYLGSRFYAGNLTDGERAARDAEGLSVGEVMAAHRPQFPPPPVRRLRGYVEAHIEQGPVLESEGLALGVVESISGQTRTRVYLEGRSGHAGTTPMNMRRDALAGAAECVGLVESMAKATDGLVATVGELRIASPASNVIPGLVEWTLDLRAADDAVRQGFSRELFSAIEARMAARCLTVRWESPLAASCTDCSPRLAKALAKAVERVQGRCPRLVSGAGHDAVALAEVTDVGMLFVRCRDGLSHHPNEYVEPEDLALAVQVMTDYLAGES